MKQVTCVAPVNIAVIKYWGKRDEVQILPINDSISATLSTDYMCAKTTIQASPEFRENKFWLNGKEEIFDSPRLASCLKELKTRITVERSDISSWNLHICSENNFPTAAGLASSAAGYACMVYALATLYGVHGDISSIARRGSGSACRSVFGGWVWWHMGSEKDGTDSIATQIVPASHWPEMRIVVLVVNAAQKKDSSTQAMKRGVDTSELLKYRAETIVPPRVNIMVDAIIKKDFNTFAQLTMQDSNQFHGVCLDSFPPCFYMTSVSHAIIEMIHMYNDYKGTNKVAYTFDAGPNACLYLLESEVAEVLSLINCVFPDVNNTVEYIKGLPVDISSPPEDLKKLFIQKQLPGSLKYIIHTSVGEGPKILDDPSDHLLCEAGLPKQ